ncbi:MAG: twin-arginine translocase subunit TatC [Prevotellaceae bacterium]|jgi:sec-independent protein translocase protein TatC|nr:twin-arginine translocase subunit TatC [Prevotellaceae bacterium]
MSFFEKTPKESSFWVHVEAFRWLIIRSFAITIVIFIVVFLFKDFVFGQIILAPARNNFVKYSFLCKLGIVLSMPELCPEIQELKIININLASQLFVHLSMSFYIGLIIAIPYLMAELWMFAAPALYKNERTPAIKSIFAFVVLFFIGVLLAYYVIFPLTVNFLGTYQIDKSVENQISLNSYIDTFLTLILMMGLVFELPIVAYFFAKIGVLKNSFLKRYRKFAFVIVLIAAAFITPSTDIFTMMLVAVPLYLLFEFSRLVVKKVEQKQSI